MLAAIKQQSLNLVATCQIITYYCFIVLIKCASFCSLNYYLVSFEQSLLAYQNFVRVVNLIYLLDGLLV